jgi:membrane associated rhomboid family serine protease
MGLYDRDYTQENYRQSFGQSPQMRMGLPSLTPVVKWLLIINAAVFLAEIISPRLGDFIVEWFAVDPSSVPRALQPWRVVSYQFLHVDAIHIAFNMIGLYFLGPILESRWGSRRFLVFYLSCGAAGGLFYMFLAGVQFLPAGPMLGASGAILGILAACAILFPQIVVFIVVFPVPIRVAVAIFTFLYLISVVTGQGNAGGDAAHLAGMAAGASYVLSESWRSRLKLKLGSGRWKKMMQRQQDMQIEVDRILNKIHDQGIHHLTRREKRLLKQATDAERKRHKL